MSITLQENQKRKDTINSLHRQCAPNLRVRSDPLGSTVAGCLTEAACRETLACTRPSWHYRPQHLHAGDSALQDRHPCCDSGPAPGSQPGLLACFPVLTSPPSSFASDPFFLKLIDQNFISSFYFKIKALKKLLSEIISRLSQHKILLFLEFWSEFHLKEKEKKNM